MAESLRRDLAPEEPIPSPAAAPAPRVRVRLLLVLGLVWLLAAGVARGVQSDWGQVQVVALRLPTQGGQWIAADLFRPRTATKEQPAPLCVVVPGFQRSKEALQNVAIELARRGVVAMVIDPYAQGNSSASGSRRAATDEGYGLFAVLDFVAGTELLDYVDTSRIVATGHSAGGNAVLLAAARHGRQVRRSERPSVLHSVFVSGYLLCFTDKNLRDVRSNVGASYALYDEGAYRNELGHGDLRRAPEALRLINTASGAGFEPVDEVTIGRWYGDVATRGARIVHNEADLHPLQPYSLEAVANQIAYFDRVLGLTHGLAPTDQTWWWKELMTFVCLLAAFAALPLVARAFLCGVALFSPLVQPMPPPLPQTARGRTFWILLVVGATIACLTYIPASEWSQRWFAEAANREQTWFFPQRMNNAVMLWALCNGAVGFLLFWLGRRLHGVSGPIAGWRLAPGHWWRTILLAAVLYVLFQAQLAFLYWFWHVDLRLGFLGGRSFDARILPLVMMYAPAFLPFFVQNSLRACCGMRHDGVPEWRSRLLAMFANSLGLLLILAAQYGWLAWHGVVLWTDGWLYVNMLFAIAPMMFVLPWFHREFFVMTGRVHLGPLVMCPIFITLMVTNTVCYLPH